jgi:hypothetical protein
VAKRATSDELRIYRFTFSVPLTGIPHTVPEYVTVIVPAVPDSAALPLGNENGQLTPPWLTTP